MHTFHLVRVGETQAGWYLEIKPNDGSVRRVLKQRVTTSATLRERRDPHYASFRKKGHPLPTPVILGILWQSTAARWAEKGRTMLVNQIGGMMPLDKSVTIIGTEQRKDMVWPDKGYDPSKSEYDNSERFIITRWGDGAHYYVQSRRRMSPDKFDSLSEAQEWCEKTNPRATITVERNKATPVSGD